MIGLLLWAVLITLLCCSMLGWVSLFFVPVFFMGFLEGVYGKGNLPDKIGITLVLSAMVLGGIGLGMEFYSKIWGILAIPTIGIMFYFIQKYDTELSK